MSKKSSSSTRKGRDGEDSYDMPGTAKSMETEYNDRELENAMPGENKSTETYQSHGDMPGSSMNDDTFRTTDNGTPQTRRCGTMEVHRRLLSTDPHYARARTEIENLTLRFAAAANANGARAGVTRIPVVVHVVWNTAAQNLSE